jgi:hypothetical protein
VVFLAPPVFWFFGPVSGPPVFWFWDPKFDQRVFWSVSERTNLVRFAAKKATTNGGLKFRWILKLQEC